MTAAEAAIATKQDLRDVAKDLKLWLGTMVAIVATLLFGALHLWPPH